MLGLNIGGIRYSLLPLFLFLSLLFPPLPFPILPPLQMGDEICVSTLTQTDVADLTTPRFPT